ncbi:hypothetical protein GCM10009841_04020 [Microlunatus panaciterrae]
MSHHGHVQLVVLQSWVNADPLEPFDGGPGFGGISPGGGPLVACGCEVGLVMGSDAAGVHAAPRMANSAAQDSQRALLVNRVILSPEEFGDTSLAPSVQEWSGQMAGFDESDRKFLGLEVDRSADVRSQDPEVQTLLRPDQSDGASGGPRCRTRLDSAHG